MLGTPRPTDTERREAIASVFGPDTKKFIAEQLAKILGIPASLVEVKSGPGREQPSVWGPVYAMSDGTLSTTPETSGTPFDPAPDVAVDGESADDPEEDEWEDPFNPEPDPAPSSDTLPDDYQFRVFFVGQRAEVLNQISRFILSKDDGLKWTPEALRNVRRVAVRSLEKQAEMGAPAEFLYDCVPAAGTYNGQSFDVYVVRGSEDARYLVRSAMTGMGGCVAGMGEPGAAAVANAASVFRRETVENITVKECPPPAVEEAPAAGSHHSPSDLRQRLRNRYGARRAQMVRFGVPEDAAAYISDRIAHKLRQGESIVPAIEDSALEWYVKNEDWEAVDIHNMRVDAGRTIPRLIDGGWPVDKAYFVGFNSGPFIEVGVSVQRAIDLAEELWDVREAVREEGSLATYHQKLMELHNSLQEKRRNFLLRSLVERNQECPSGARWIAETAADLCKERNPKTNRGYRLKEAVEQVMGEWANMSREARIAIRREKFWGRLESEALREDQWFTENWTSEYLGNKGKPPIDATHRIHREVEVLVSNGLSLKEAVEAATAPPPPMPVLGANGLVNLLYCLAAMAHEG